MAKPASAVAYSAYPPLDTIAVILSPTLTFLALEPGFHHDSISLTESKNFIFECNFRCPFASDGSYEAFSPAITGITATQHKPF